MTKEEAKKYAKDMTYLDAINNLMKARSIPYSKATFIKVNELLKALEWEPKWIPVERELPKDKQEVLITYKINVKHHVWSAIWDILHGRFYDKEYRSYISLNYVTAWMPLPKPYEPLESEVIINV